MLQIAEQWGFKCVENYCWIRMTPNNRCYLQESPIFNKTKLTMLVFRRIKEKVGALPFFFASVLLVIVWGTIKDPLAPFSFSRIVKLLSATSETPMPGSISSSPKPRERSRRRSRATSMT